MVGKKRLEKVVKKPFIRVANFGDQSLQHMYLLVKTFFLMPENASFQG